MRVLIVKIDQEHFQLTDNQLRNRVLKSIYNDSASTLQKLFRREIEKEEAWRNEDIKEEIAFPEGQSA